jgi:hypothetical protein
MAWRHVAARPDPSPTEELWFDEAPPVSRRGTALIASPSWFYRVGRPAAEVTTPSWQVGRRGEASRPCVTFPRGATQRVACFCLQGRTAMTDKSPHETHSAKKSGKALKAKRTERKEKQDAAAQMQRLMHPRKQGG